MLRRERELIVMAAQIEEGIDPGVEIGAAAETVTGAAIGGNILAGVVHEGNGGSCLALQNPQVAQQGGDFTSGILVDSVKADQRIED